MKEKEEIEHFNLFRTNKQYFLFKRKRSLYILFILMLLMLSGILIFFFLRNKTSGSSTGNGSSNSTYSISSLKLPSENPVRTGGFRKL